MLSGIQPPKTPVLEQLKADKEVAMAAYDQLIASAEQGQQLDEGLFTSLKAALSTVGQLGAKGAKKVGGAVSSAGSATAGAVKKVSADVKELYLDNKAKAELEDLVKSLRGIVSDFEKIEKDSSVILKKDAEIKKEMELLATLLNKVIGSVSIRLMAPTLKDRVEPT
jgi:poly-gamma-glutamate capsule biosynthesis protein CapA/YwtB (metallophosphatase superfamily)